MAAEHGGAGVRHPERQHIARTGPCAAEYSAGLAESRGIGDQKLADFGDRILEAVTDYSQARDLSRDVRDDSAIVMPPKRSLPNPVRDKAFTMFAQGEKVADVAAMIGRAVSTTGQYLEDYVRRDQVKDVSLWVDSSTYERIKQAAMGLEERRAKPIFEALNSEVPYEQIRVVMAHLEVMSNLR